MNTQKTANNGRRGEDHPRATMTGREIELMRNLYADGGWSYASLAAKFECSKSQVQHVIKERKRIWG